MSASAIEGARAGVLGTVDHRVPVTDAGWPWSSIGRVNRAGRSFCTGTLVGPNRVLTAAHCVFDLRTGRRAGPDELHFLAGYDHGGFAAESVVQRIILDERYQPKPAAPGSMTADWAILILKDRFALKPILLFDESSVPAALERGTLVRAGYSQDRPHVLTMHRGCAIEKIYTDLLLHSCDSAHGDSGSPLLLLERGAVRIIGIHVAILGGENRQGAAIPAATFASANRPR